MLKKKLKAILVKYYKKRNEKNAARQQHEECAAILKTISNSKDISSDYKELIQNYYHKYTKGSNDTIWHKLYFNANGYKSEKYIPIDLLFTKIIPTLNDSRFSEAYSDKSQYERLFPDITQPYTYIKRINGIFYIENKPISLEDAVKLFPLDKKVVFKPTIDTSQGEGIKVIPPKTLNNEEIKLLLSSTCDNFVIQSYIKSHKVISRLNESSLNTLRIVTYRCDTEVRVLSVTLKIGKMGESVDNGHHGGFFCGVDETGKLRKYVYTLCPFTKSETTENGIKIEGEILPAFDNVIEKVKKCALRLPYSRYAGWDIAIDENKEPILIEVNLKCPGGNIMQIPNGPLLGDETDSILKEIFEKS